MAATKVCSRCRRELPVTAFRFRGRGGLLSECRVCQRRRALDAGRIFPSHLRYGHFVPDDWQDEIDLKAGLVIERAGEDGR